MKCYKCNNSADLLTSDGKSICRSCAEKCGYAICSELGKVIVNKDFHCNNMCNDCIYSESIKNGRI